MRPGPLPVLALLMLAAAFFAGYRAEPQPQLARPARPVEPFTIQMQESMHTQDPTISPHAFTRVVALRSDGADMTAFSAVSPTGETGQVVDIYDVPNRKNIILEPFTKSASTYFLSVDEMSAARGEIRSCTPSEAALFNTPKALPVLLGHTVAPEVRQGKGSERTESWIARDLDCFPLRETETSERGSWNERVVTSIDEGEPLSSLFSCPSGYVERSPGQIEALYAAKYGQSHFGQMTSTYDSRYYAHRPK